MNLTIVEFKEIVDSVYRANEYDMNLTIVEFKDRSRWLQCGWLKI